MMFMFTAGAVIPLLLIIIFPVVCLTAYSSLHTVQEGNLEALFVFGKMNGVLQPGLNVVPAFVSSTHPIDPQTMTIDTGDDRIPIPDEYEAEVREATTR